MKSDVTTDPALGEPDPSASGGVAPSDSAVRARLAEPGTRIGRYEVIERLGSGGMGAVFLARDHDLDRPVALKILHADMADKYRARLFAEARTMARFTHPHVVSVFDVGEHDGRIFLAMEPVDGGTMRQWLAERQPSWTQIVEAYCKAARGLYAAHQAGVIHRDLKPDNILVGSDGEVKVTDFGMARVQEPLRDRIAMSIGPQSVDSFSQEDLQRGMLGKLGGTPAYMAPEAIRGHAGGRRADQFSFCVALYEGLCGERPFVADSVPALFTKIFTGSRQPRPHVTLPAAVWAVLDRGLQVDATRRFASMAQLEAALERCTRPATRRRPGSLLAVGTTGAVALGAVVVGVLAWGNAQGSECEGLGAGATVWGASARTRVRAAIEAPSDPAWSRIDAALERWDRQWQQARSMTCAELDAQSSRTSLPCLDAQRRDVVALIELFAEPDATIIEHAVEAVTQLPRPTSCRDDPHPPSMPSTHAADGAPSFVATRQKLAHIRALRRVGRHAQALSLAQAQQPVVRALDDASLLAAMSLELAALLLLDDQTAEAERIYTEAFVAATAHDNPRAAAEATLGLLEGSVQAEGDPQTGYRWARLVEGPLRRLEPHANALKITRHHHLAALDLVHGRLDQSLRHAQLARALADTTFESDDPRRATYRTDEARALARLGRFDESHDRLREARAQLEQVLGPHHPRVVASWRVLAEIARLQGDTELAEAATHRGLR
ncbi:MAG: serine/threonine-protein kinase [Deltaproteobacteria bacterium]|nr:serine/threonine-protein kinase [Deltaproteobacteria bacterium]